ncbi:hypothetical protein BpHYR1_031088 [Brachionus plicatilis]|uniref:Uncharacterized protein n=1 Tax=Brachionus plicatilis TaxID=10195 RepID=A0A3M7RIP4_BRAPC|nr:hypothetical protein BpHYR1_031088 [Brachionus plicatilis]
MTSSPAKPVRFYKIGGFKQTDPYKNQNLNPFQYAYANQYPFMFYQNQQMQYNSLTPKKQPNTPPDQAFYPYDNKNSQKINQYDTKQNTIEEDDEIENQLETIEEENLVITKKKNPDTIKNEELTKKVDEKPKAKETTKVKATDKSKEIPREKETQKTKEIDKGKEKPKAKEQVKVKEPEKEEVVKQKSTKNKQVEEKDLNSEISGNKKELVEKYETNEKTKIETPRSKDGKPFSIRGTTKTVIEVTTTEIVDESIFKTKDDTKPKLIKKTPEKNDQIDQIEDKKDNEPTENSDKEIEEAKTTGNEIIESTDKEIQTDDGSKVAKVVPIKKEKSLNKKVDKETETSEPKVDKFLDDEPSNDEKPRAKKKVKKLAEPSKPTDDEETPRRDNLRSRRDLVKNKPETKKDFDVDDLVPRKRVSHSLDDKKKIEQVKSVKEPKIGKSNSVKHKEIHNNQFYLPVIKNLDKIQAKRFEKSKNDFKFPSLVTEKPAPHRFKLKFSSNESVNSSYEGYKRCPCLMHRRRYYAKFGFPPDQESSNLRPKSIKSDQNFEDQSNQHFEKSFILSDRNGKYPPRNKTSVEKYIDDHLYQNMNQSFYSDSEMLMKPSWNEAF